MGFKTVTLQHPSQLPLALKSLGSALEGATVKALRRTARFGHTAVVRTMSKTTPKPEASYTYRNGWTVVKTRTGAILGNSALHSYFVEVGRRAGKMPPFSDPTQGVLLWVQLKRFRFDKEGAIKKRKKKKRKPGSIKKKSPAASKVAAQRKKAQGDGPQAKQPPRRRKAKGAQLAAQQRFAYLVAKKISKSGTPGRYVLARTMPAIQKRALREQKKAMKTVTQQGGQP